MEMRQSKAYMHDYDGYWMHDEAHKIDPITGDLKLL